MSGGIEGHQGCIGGWWGIGGIRGVLGAGRECRYSGASRGKGGIRGLLGAVRGDWGCLGAGRGV